ncbi:glucarate transporter [Robbsia andropogonis]|uniref:Glucarate transporter n=1 Tax=Robbsia andropogonis TaxID=28092 RepID=A0A0F5JX21_9BURK|nr:MFS transporter [Robbsia andropogonis]KKB62174.1 glucarate transporter [Robbsia andropogonis]MCP1119441.1 MFS transporter [Robbsia andropogonis]MCP1129424.1 MFS transporter [Robbsia andropogonis]
MDASRVGSAAGVMKRTNTRFLILAMLFIITTFNYADRATLSITGSEMSKELGFSTVQMGYIFSAFAWSYVIAQVPAGWLLDRYGARRVYATSIFVWSLFTMMQGAVGITGSAAFAVGALFALRFLMGAAEAPAFPANAKVVSSWFPTKERGTASAIFNSAQYFAAVVFTPLMAWITHTFGWHHVYTVMGLAGIVLSFIWLRTMKSPSQHPMANKAEVDYIRDGGGIVDVIGSTASTDGKRRDQSWFYAKQLLKSKMLLGIYLAQFCISVLTYFFLTWFPIYLVQARHMTILKAGLIASLPAICGFIGGVLGGFISDWLIKRGHSLTVARKVPIVTGMLLSSSIIACNYVSATWLVVLFMSLAFFGKGIGALGWAVVSDTSPREAVGLSGSIFNMFGNISGIVTPIVIGYIVATRGSFNGALVFVGINALITVFSYLFIVGDIKRFELKQPS